LKHGWAILFLCTGTYTFADGLPISDLNPLLSGYELPALLSSEDPYSKQAIEVSYNVSNTSLDQQTASEHVIVDAELHKWQLSYARPLTKNWNIIVELPYRSVSGGSLDSFIEHFHNTFNLPDGNRKEWPRDRLLVDYSQDNSHYHLDNAQSGLGDVALRAGWHFDASSSHTTSLWFALKLPTGNATHLTGSGSVDASITLAAQQVINDDLHAFEQASMSLLGNGSRMSAEQKNTVWSGALGASWALNTRFDAVTQIQTHSAVFDSQLKILGTATQFSIGPRYHTRDWQASLAITEDIVPDSAPDVQFQFDLSYRF